MIRQKFIDAFPDKVPIQINKIIPGKGVFFFNAYSYISISNKPLQFDINNTAAARLIDIHINSMVAQVKFTASEVIQSYVKNGKNRNDRMREGIISDRSRALKTTVWNDIIELIKEGHLVQLCNATSKIYHEELVISTNYSTSVCYLTESLDVKFDESVLPKTPDDCGDFVVCFPQVQSIKVDSFLPCKVCRKKIIISSGTGFCVCTSCKREFTVKLLENTPGCSQRTVVPDIRNQVTAMTVTIFDDVLSKFFGEEEKI